MTVLSHPQLESVWIEVSSNKIKYFIGTVYRPPSAPSVFWEILNDNLETALNLSKHVIILGDFNEDILNPNLHNFKDIILLNNLKNVITEPTRVTETTSTLLDPILVTDEIINLHSGVTSVDNSISDHNLTFLHCQHENTANTSYKRKIWLYKEADLKNLNEAIKLLNWNYFFESYHDVDIAANFGDKLMEFAHLHIPNKIVTIRRNDKPWYDNTI